MTTEHAIDASRLLAGRTRAVVLAAMWPQQPDGLLAAVIDAARAADIGLTVLFADLTGSLAFLDEAAEHDVLEGRLQLVSVAGAIPKRWSPHIDYLPQSLWDVDRLIGTGEIPVDILLARVVATAKPEHVALGGMVGYTPAALRTGCKVGLEVVPGHTFAGPEPVPLDRADAVVHGPASTPRRTIRFSAEQETIGHAVASLVPDGATVQLGLGAVPEAVIPHLRTKRDLGVHSGILSAGIRELIAAGVVTGHRKTAEPGWHVATGVLDWPAHQCPGLALQPVAQTHAPDRLLAQERLWAVNSAFEIDLAGQTNAEFTGGVRVASGGGQADFVRAAHASPGGAAVLALPSRTRQGRSRIVACLPAPHIPTSPGAEIDVVVTEHGTAWLRGRTAREKAAALIAVAHPADRPALSAAVAHPLPERNHCSS
ncbi:acetyl-CoA hydrolase/transferase C-terminal domain-containing protein [Saccharopolyspora sp. NPDC000995]